MNLLWLMDPPDQASRSTLPLPPDASMADGPLSESRIDTLNPSTPNLADEPTLANATDIC